MLNHTIGLEEFTFETAMRGVDEALERFRAEINFAKQLITAFPEHQGTWERLISDALSIVANAIHDHHDIHTAIQNAESALTPIGIVAKTFTIHCVGHAHIDMNWMWGWHETAAIVNDTFSTVDTLMDEFPDFRFSQDQGLIYFLMKEHLPWLFERVKQRIQEGRWEITASQWVEGDKNMPSGESICRHVLYTRRFLQEELGIPYDAVRIDWEPDAFGHAHTMPSLIASGGVRWYYFCRAGRGPHLFWWQGPDHARILAFDDLRKWFNNTMTPAITDHLLEFVQETGLHDYLFVYGVGDHGGGPTRRDLRMAQRMNRWPIFPRIRFSTAAEYFQLIEPLAQHLPTVEGELNSIFEGCYLSQSRIKHANRRSEHALCEAEAFATIAQRQLGLPYPHQALRTAWHHAMFNQFHDILPGSGIRQTYDYAMGLYQEILTRTTTAKTHALRELTQHINTAAVCPSEITHINDVGLPAGQGLGGGFGDIASDGAVTRYGAGETNCEPFVIFNPTPWQRSGVITARLWNRTYPPENLVVRDGNGTSLPVQFIKRDAYWWLEHEYTEIAFPVQDLPSLGYATYCVSYEPNKTSTEQPTCRGYIDGIGNQGAETEFYSYPGPVRGILENEYLIVEIEETSGTIVHLLDKRSGVDLVPPGERMALLEYILESPDGMSAWNIGQTSATQRLLDGATIQCLHAGPYLATIRITRAFQDSTISMD
ncbi:MAG TPA: glycoside hydrolase family 38 C-terminal domain-containing protein, partial [Armatimonadota bacterium]|nr:glycoside hydrolase family 38 C-terminal domain-containing protein [Armatimonadota bacterium]